MSLLSVQRALVAAGWLAIVLSFAAGAEPPTPAAEIATLEKKLSATRDELNAAKTALAISQAQTQAAEARAQGAAQTDSQLNSLRSQVRILERDLQSATAALKRLAADKTTVEAALAAANDKLSTLTDPNAARPAPLPAAPDPKSADLQASLNDARTRLAAAEKTAASRDAELARLKSALSTAESKSGAGELEVARRSARDAERRLTVIAQELADVRAQLGPARELEARVRQLEADKASLISRAAEHSLSKEDFTRVSAAQADAERKLAGALEAQAAAIRERDDLRTQATRTRELEARIRQLEAEKAAAPVAVAPPAPAAEPGAANKDEVARVTAARADAESKLATALRSYTLLSRERDELKVRLAELTAKVNAPPEKR